MDVVQVSWTVDADLVAAVNERARGEALPRSRMASRLLRSALELPVAAQPARALSDDQEGFQEEAEVEKKAAPEPIQRPGGETAPGHAPSTAALRNAEPAVSLPPRVNAPSEFKPDPKPGRKP